MKKCANHYAVAVDLGASGGKMAAASFDGSRIELADYITFPNQPVQILDTLYWDDRPLPQYCFRYDPIRL